MKKLIPIMFVFLFFANIGFADNGNSKVLAMLKKNPIVNAAVAEAKKFTGAKTCEYTIESTEPEQFQKGTTFDYSADITCTCIENESAAMIHVEGRMFSPDGPQALTLSIGFAG